MQEDAKGPLGGPSPAHPRLLLSPGLQLLLWPARSAADAAAGALRSALCSAAPTPRPEGPRSLAPAAETSRPLD